MKTCSKCDQSKPLSEFYVDRRLKDGRKSICAACDRAARQAYTSTNPDKVRQTNQKYRASNRDTLNAQSRRYYAETKEARAAHRKAYRQAHPEFRWRDTYTRRMREFGYDPGEVALIMKADVIETYGDACFHCGGSFEELDHFPIPVRDGGPHTIENVKPACARCNRSWRKKERS